MSFWIKENGEPNLAPWEAVVVVLVVIAGIWWYVSSRSNSVLVIPAQSTPSNATQVMQQQPAQPIPAGADTIVHASITSTTSTQTSPTKTNTTTNTTQAHAPQPVPTNAMQVIQGKSASGQ